MSRQREKKVNGAKGYGNKLGYSIFQFVLKYLGMIPAYGMILFLVPYYVILRPDVYRRSKPYLMRRFPGDSFPRRYLRLFKYIFIFAKTLLDQFYFGFVGESKFTLEFDREPEMLAILNKRPVIFLMSHVGFWEIAMAGSARFKRKMNVMVNKNFDKDKRKSFYDIRQKEEFGIINVSDPYGGMIEATNALLRGEVIGVTGDRADQWRSKSVSFLGSPAQFPVIAPLLSAATGASVMVLFTSKVGKYHVRLHWEDISSEILLEKKLTKNEKIQKILENYSKALERHVEKQPYLWFNFFDFWKE